MNVVPVDKETAAAFVRRKHYSRRMSIFWTAFGLEEAGMIEGVVVYGQPSPPVQRHAFAGRDFRLYELSRLVIQTKTRNAASFLVARSLAMLPAPCAVVSYADTEWGHAGIVYQATNWLYTGATESHDHAYMVHGARLHPTTLRDRGITNPKQWARENGYATAPPMLKHRYFQFVGTRRERADMRARLVYPEVKPYPKSAAVRYDDGAPMRVHAHPQGNLFA